MEATDLKSDGLETREEREQFVLNRQGSDSLAELEIFPQYVNVETTNACNARCVMCGIDFDNRPNVKMDDALFDKIVEELKAWNHHIRKVNLYSDNEPLLDRNLAKKIRILKDIGIQTVAIATNASALTQTRAEELVAAGLDQIYITIDSMVPEVYEKIRVRLSFDKVYANTVNFIRVRDAAKASTAVRIQMVLQESNYGESASFASHWEPLLSEGDHIVVHRAHNWGGTVETLAHEGDATVNTYPCTTLWANAMIHADGKMALCSVDTEHVSPFTLGDVREQSIEDIWNCEDMKSMREKHLTNQRDSHILCNGCTTWRECKSEAFIEVASDKPT